MKTQSQDRMTVKHAARRGFTLVELLLVLMVLGILAAVALPQLRDIPDKARIKAAKTQIAVFDTALDAYQMDVGDYPETQDGLNALRERPGDAAGWQGPYLKTDVPSDPWEKPYVYEKPGTHNPTAYDIYSFGKDGQEGSDDDIGSWLLAQK